MEFWIYIGVCKCVRFQRKSYIAFICWCIFFFIQIIYLYTFFTANNKFVHHYEALWFDTVVHFIYIHKRTFFTRMKHMETKEENKQESKIQKFITEQRRTKKIILRAEGNMEQYSKWSLQFKRFMMLFFVFIHCYCYVNSLFRFGATKRVTPSFLYCYV